MIILKLTGVFEIRVHIKMIILTILSGRNCFIQFSTRMAGWLLLTFYMFTQSFNPIQDGGQKGPPTSFFPVTSTNIGFGP